MTSDKKDLNLLTEVANRLNAMLEADNITVEKIFSPIVVSSRTLAASTCECFMLDNNTVATTPLGVLIGALPLYTNTYTLKIAYVESRIMGFSVVNCKEMNAQNSKEI